MVLRVVTASSVFMRSRSLVFAPPNFAKFDPAARRLVNLIGDRNGARRHKTAQIKLAFYALTFH
jgi:hypothetical protein